MKHFLSFWLLLVLLHYSASAQRILFKETSTTNTNNTEVFGKFINGAIQRSYCNTEIALNSGNTALLRWTSSTAGDILWTNGVSLFKYKFDTQRNVTIAENLNIILEMATCGRFAYIVTHPDGAEGRYSSGLKLTKINLETLKKENIQVPAGVNFTNLSVSADGNILAFINTVNHDDPSLEEFRFTLYDVITKSYSVIDKAKRTDDEYFGSTDRYNSSVWMDSNKLLYYKHAKNNINGSIMYYDLRTRAATTWLQNIPDKSFKWFSYADQWFYFSDDKNIYKTKDGMSKQIVYQQNVQQAILVQQ